MNNYADQLNALVKKPETVDEAVEQLMLVLTDEQKSEVAVLTEENLINLHFSLGLVIRNAFGLHESGNKLLADCETLHPDDASGVVIQTWKS